MGTLQERLLRVVSYLRVGSQRLQLQLQLLQPGRLILLLPQILLPSLHTQTQSHDPYL